MPIKTILSMFIAFTIGFATSPSYASDTISCDSFEGCVDGSSDVTNILLQMQAEIAALEAMVTTLQSELAANTAADASAHHTKYTDAESIAAVGPHSPDTSALLAGVSRGIDPNTSQDSLTFTNMNVQIVNGSGTTNGATTGTGNLIIGYNELRGAFDDRTGSHVLVIGSQNNYTSGSFGGMAVGQRNTISGEYSSVSGGNGNTASGGYSSVSGGYGNTASGHYSSISGGDSNTTSGGLYSSISGGGGNTASGFNSSVSGGNDNTASGEYSSVSGGFEAKASGNYSSVLGGDSNTASGAASSISGGYAAKAIGNYSSVSGGFLNTASGNYSSVLGGGNKTAATSICVVGDNGVDC